MRQLRKTSTEEFHKKLQKYTEVGVINHTTTWEQCLKLFSQDRLLQLMLPVDALGVFEEMINPLYEQWRLQIRAKYRQNRIVYRELLQHNLAEGWLNHKTKWSQYVLILKEDERFTTMLG